MDTRQIGGLDVSVVGLGCNNFGMRIDEAQTKAVVDAALDAGVNYFDTAEGYGGGRSEEFLGAALAGRRDQAVIATKWGMRPPEDGEPANGSPERVRAAIEGSLRRLGVDHVDHYQMHNPDPSVPIDETLGALRELVAEGKVLEIGCSNFSAEQLDAAPSFATVQNHYSVLTRDVEKNGVLDACERNGIGFVPYFPLESGVLTGKYTSTTEIPEGTRLAAWGDAAGAFLTEERLAAVQAATAWARTRGRSILDCAIAWLISNPRVVTVIAGATKPEQVQANAAAAQWRMTPAERTKFERYL